MDQSTSRETRRSVLDEPPTAAEIEAELADSEGVAELRRRFKDLSWFMKALRETVARRANGKSTGLDPHRACPDGPLSFSYKQQSSRPRSPSGLPRWPIVFSKRQSSHLGERFR
jgi:hypothetical protein